MREQITNNFQEPSCRNLACRNVSVMVQALHDAQVRLDKLQKQYDEPFSA